MILLHLIKTSKHIYTFPFLSIILSSCITLQTHQTGRSLGKDNLEVAFSANVGKFESKMYPDFFGNELFYMGEMRVSCGVRDRLDLGIKFNTSTHIEAISKFQFIGDKKSFFASSLGLNVGGSPFILPNRTISLNSSVALYNSIHLTDKIAISLSPKYSYLRFDNFQPDVQSTLLNNVFGYSTGITFGKTHQLSLEYSQFVNNDSDIFNGGPIFAIGYKLQISESTIRSLFNPNE